MRAAWVAMLAAFGRCLRFSGSVLLRFFRMVVIVMRYCLGDLRSGKLGLVVGVQYIGLCRSARGGLVHRSSQRNSASVGWWMCSRVCREFLAHDDNGFMVMMMMMVVVPSVVLVIGECRQRRTQQRCTEQQYKQ